LFNSLTLRCVTVAGWEAQLEGRGIKRGAPDVVDESAKKRPSSKEVNKFRQAKEVRRSMSSSLLLNRKMLTTASLFPRTRNARRTWRGSPPSRVAPLPSRFSPIHVVFTAVSFVHHFAKRVEYDFRTFSLLDRGFSKLSAQRYGHTETRRSAERKRGYEDTTEQRRKGDSEEGERRKSMRYSSLFASEGLDSAAMPL
jgi:hypothetical protein